MKSRKGGGNKKLSYIEAHDAIRTANEIFGPGEWGYEVQDLSLLGEEPVTKKNDQGERKGYRVGYRAVVKVTVYKLDMTDGPPRGTSFSDTGYGDAVEYTGSSITPHELAAKEAVSDGIKRALKNFGDQFGLGLYAKDKPRDEEEDEDVEPDEDNPLTVAEIKWKVQDLAASLLGKEDITGAEIAEVFDVELEDLQDVATLEGIIAKYDEIPY